MTLEELLRRFRRHGVPGAARPTGVPADLASEREAELAPVFDALEPVLHQAEDLVAAAALDASRLAQQAATDGRSRVEEAREQAGGVAAAETASVLRRVDAEMRQTLAVARREAQREEMLASPRIPVLAERIVAVASELPRRRSEP